MLGCKPPPSGCRRGQIFCLLPLPNSRRLRQSALSCALFEIKANSNQEIVATLKAFKGFRPPVQIVQQLASRPYDVLNSQEARIEAQGNPYSLLHIVKSEIDLPEDVDVHADEVFERARANFELFKQNQWLVQDDKDCLYIYALSMNGNTQYGLVGCASVEDYRNGVIKKHELTRPDKEEDRVRHMWVTNAHVEPVLFSYPAHAGIDEVVDQFVSANPPVYDFTANDGVTHQFWVIRDDETINTLIALFAELPATYIADGHHRTAAAATVCDKKRRQNPGHTGDEAYNFFLAVHFPDNQLHIMDYNRVVKDFNGHTAQSFLEALRHDFAVEAKGQRIYKPDRPHNFSMYLEGHWYSLTAKPGAYDEHNPITGLDVTTLTRHVLSPLLNITDLRTSKRIDFVGGIRGLEELQRRVDSGEMKVAFALYPVSMQQLVAIADSGEEMPPKTTWFEPKLRSGLVIHAMD